MYQPIQIVLLLYGPLQKNLGLSSNMKDEWYNLWMQYIEGIIHSPNLWASGHVVIGDQWKWWDICCFFLER